MTEAEIKEIEVLAKKNSAVFNLLEEYKSFKEDGAKVFYLQITDVVKTLSNDMKNIISGDQNNTILIRGDKDNKQFDQVKILLLDAETIFKGLKFAREYVMPELKEVKETEEKEDGMSAVDRRASKNK